MQLSRPKYIRHEFQDQSEKGAIFQTKAETARLSGPRWIRREFSDQRGEGSNFQTIAETARPKINSSRPRRRRRNFLDQSAYGANFQTKSETARIFRRRRRRPDFPDHRGDGATKNQFLATQTETA